jgi:hypothetical protein
MIKPADTLMGNALSSSKETDSLRSGDFFTMCWSISVSFFLLHETIRNIFLPSPIHLVVVPWILYLFFVFDLLLLLLFADRSFD